MPGLRPEREGGTACRSSRQLRPGGERFIRIAEVEEPDRESRKTLLEQGNVLSPSVGRDHPAAPVEKETRVVPDARPNLEDRAAG